MRKNDLIKLLQTIEGNPEVVIWNGFVGDYQSISKEIFNYTLYKQNLKGYSYYLNLEAEVRDGKEPYSEEECKRYYKRCNMQYEMIQEPWMLQDDMKRGFYSKKDVIMIEPKPRGVETWDRLGTIKY